MGKEMKCKCDMMRTKLVGKSCAICNPELAQEIEDGNAFDEWYCSEYHNDSHYDILENAWMAAIRYAGKKHV